MPPEKITGYNLRERSHNLTLPYVIDNSMLRTNFLLCIECIQRYVLVARVNEMFVYCLLFVILYVGQFHSCMCSAFVRHLIKKLLIYLLSSYQL